ncbi:MAG: ATP-grasp domain-containing protein, partial [Acidimicrobiia bacterium]
MNKHWLVLVESNTTPSGAEFPRAARRLGLEPILLSSGPARYPWVAEQDVTTRAIDTAQTSEVERACASLERYHPIAGVMSSSDRFLVVAAVVARARGLAGLPPEA